MRKRTAVWGALVVVAAVAVFVVSAGSASAQTCSGAVDVQPTGTACASTLAVSGTGSASSVQGVAVSGTGNASSTTGGSCATVDASTPPAAVGCVAVSGTGNASNTTGGSCATVGAFGQTLRGAAVGCVAASGTGNATNSTAGPCASASSFEPSEVVAVGCVAASGTGTATNSTPSGCGSGPFIHIVPPPLTPGVEVGTGCVAVSPVP